MAILNFPILYAPDPLKGRPLGGGQIYVGEPDLDPEIPINQKQLNIIQEDGTIVPVSQPFILSFGGVPTYNGATVRLDVDGNYSFKLLDKNGAQKYYVENVLSGKPVTEDEIINNLSLPYVFDTVADMVASAIVFPVGKRIEWLGYHDENDGGGNWGIVNSGVHTDDGGSIFTLANGDYVKANLSKVVNVKKFGAKIDSNFDASNSPADDTLSIQAAIDYVNKDGVVYIPTGFTMVTQLLVSSGTDLRGDGAGITYVIQKAGETTPILIDDGFPINLFVRDIAFDCNHNTITTAGVYLGNVNIQLGTVGGLNNVYIRNVDGVGANINGNVSINKYIEIHGCTGTGIIINGTGNKYSNLITANCEEIGIQVLGTDNVINKSHFEGECSIACIDIGPNVVGTVIDEAHIFGSGDNIHGAGVRLGLNSKLSRVTNIRAVVDSFANIANGLIYDQSFAGGDLKLWGKDSGGIRFGVSEYNQGARAQMPFNDSSLPPTLGTFRRGDWFIGGSGDNGTPLGWVCDNNGTPGSWSPMGTVAGAIAKTANKSLVANDIGRRFCNDGAVNVVTLELPQVSAGSRIHFTRRSTFDFRIKPFLNDIIRPGGQNKYLSLDTDGASVTLEYMSNLSWCIVAQSGTVSHEP